MNEFVRLLLLVALAGTVVTFLGAAAIWFWDEERRMRRALRRVLQGPPEAALYARGRGRAMGFRFATGQAAVAWDAGAWCLIYRIDELMGAELIIDGQVAARAFRGEARRALDHVGGAVESVCLRLIFDDPRHPDFELELWLAGDEAAKVPRTAAKAAQEANRWLARAEAILRRPAAGAGSGAGSGAGQPAKVETRRPEPPSPQPLPLPDEDDEDEDAPPWDDDTSDEDDQALT
ncbi:hypothetical protein [Phenylobacterium sp.]|uniref:hypothetical protein n=1 Tax=Phenylobacterium sp. TaxID=1871053 RepID=UPI0035AF658A